MHELVHELRRAPRELRAEPHRAERAVHVAERELRLDAALDGRVRRQHEVPPPERVPHRDLHRAHLHALRRLLLDLVVAEDAVVGDALGLVLTARADRLLAGRRLDAVAELHAQDLRLAARGLALEIDHVAELATPARADDQRLRVATVTDEIPHEVLIEASRQALIAELLQEPLAQRPMHARRATAADLGVHLLRRLTQRRRDPRALPAARAGEHVRALIAHVDDDRDVADRRDRAPRERLRDLGLDLLPDGLRRARHARVVTPRLDLLLDVRAQRARRHAAHERPPREEQHVAEPHDLVLAAVAAPPVTLGGVAGQHAGLIGAREHAGRERVDPVLDRRTVDTLVLRLEVDDVDRPGGRIREAGH